MFKLNINDKLYTDYNYIDVHSMTRIDKKSNEKLYNINPKEKKLFNQDIFEIKDDSLILKYSSVRINDSIPGILLLDIMHGIHNNKPLYRVIPDDKRLPDFLVPYKKNYTFNKNTKNMYILFKYENWDNKHPIGIITNNLGPVDELSNFYEYILFCKSLQISISNFTKETVKKLKSKTGDDYFQQICQKYNIEDRSQGENFHYIFTIDGKTTQDFDDAIGIKNNTISVYISNVSLWLEIMNLWNAFSKRVSTIYLPNHKKSMMPVILSESLCSLVQKNKKIALTMDIQFDESFQKVIDISFKNTLIYIKKNYIYESEELLNNNHYKKIYDIIRNYNYSPDGLFLNPVNKSYDIITYLMIFMNWETSKILLNSKIGIYRKLDHKNKLTNYNNIPNTIHDEQKSLIFFFKSQSAQYCQYENSIYESIIHNNIKQYTHITSPIRRLVDLLNSIIIQEILGLVSFSSDAHKFYDGWITQLDYINLTMRSIRKVQNRCDILTKVTEINKTHDLNNIVYKGIPFDEVCFDNGMFQYTVLINDLKYFVKYVTPIKLNEYKEYDYNIFIFQDEDTLKRKIRVKLNSIDNYKLNI